MIVGWVGVTPDKIMVNGQTEYYTNRGAALLTEVYRAKINDYAKFFKMDTLCKLGFVASELLLAEEKDKIRFIPCEDRAIVFFNRSGSLHADKNFQQTIQDGDNYYPSPSVFVYTLPNIVTGEVAIRNHYYGETSFYVLSEMDAEVIAQHITNAFQDTSVASVLGGWIDCISEDDFFALVFIVSQQSDIHNLAEVLADEINEYINLLNS